MKRFSPALHSLAACAISLFVMSNVPIAPPQADAAQAKKNAQTRKNDDERELIRLEEEGNKLYLKGEYAKIVETWGDDAMIINPDGKVQDKAAALKDMQESKITVDSLKNSDYKIRIYGDVAVITMLTTTTGALSGQARYTDIAVKRNGKWKLVHSHGTIVQESPRIPPKKQN